MDCAAEGTKIYAVTFDTVLHPVSYTHLDVYKRQGHHKTDDEVDELERLRRENLRLKSQLKEKDMLTELLKKVKEFERM